MTRSTTINWSAKLATASGLPRWAHRRLYPGHLTILMYHGLVERSARAAGWCFLEVSAFRRQMDYLARRFEVLPLEDAIARQDQLGLTRPTAVVTFDDGFQSVNDLALPILQALGLPAMVYLTTDYVDSDLTFWFCRLIEAFRETPLKRLVWGGNEYDLTTPEARIAASESIQNSLKKLAWLDLQRELERLQAELQVEGGQPVPPDSPFRVLSSDSIAAMQRGGLIDFGSHTCHHAILGRADDALSRHEIEGSLRAVQRLTGRPCRHFSYPNGTQRDYGPREIETLRAHAVHTAVTTISGPNTPGTPRLQLRRYGVGADLSQARFELFAHHWWR